MAVLAKSDKKHFSTSLFIMSLALADLFVSGYFIDGFLIANDYIRGSYNVFDCKLRHFLSGVGSEASPFTLTLISIEREFCIVVPHKVKHIFTRRVSICLTLFVWLFSKASKSMRAENNVFVITPYGAYICVIDRVAKSVMYEIIRTADFITKK
jgi:hypothetical protein